MGQKKNNLMTCTQNGAEEKQFDDTGQHLSFLSEYLSSLKLFHNYFYYKDSEVVSIWWTLVTVLLLILPALSQIIPTTCEIPSVEAGDVATLTIHFGDDLIQKQERDFRLTHLDRNDKETRMLSCTFSNGNVECDKTPCCTWKNKVTNVFRVYIHNASQQLEGKFWGFVVPGDTTYQKYCNFILKASSCPIDHINTTNSHMTCNNQTVTIGQSCTVTCNSGHYFQENQSSVTYTCVGRNKWSPEMSVTSCEAYACPKNVITAKNSHVFCSDKIVTIGHTCTMTCISGHYFQENQTSVTYTCVWKNKWSPELPVRSCEASGPENTDLDLGPIIGSVCAIVVLIAVIIVVIVIVQKRRVRRKSVTKPYESTTPPRSESEKSSSKTNSYSEAGEIDPTVRIDEGADHTVTYTIPGAPGAHPRSTRSTAQRSKRGPPQAVPTEQAAREEQPEYIEIESETRHNGDDGYLVPASQYASLSTTTKSEEGHEYEKFGPKPTGSSSTTEYSGLIKSTKREKHLYDVLEKKETKQKGETGKQDPSRAAVVKKGSGKTSSSVKS